MVFTCDQSEIALKVVNSKRLAFRATFRNPSLNHRVNATELKNC